MTDKLFVNGLFKITSKQLYDVMLGGQLEHPDQNNEGREGRGSLKDENLSPPSSESLM